MPIDAYNVKISEKSWQLLRWAKFELGVKSYSEAIKEMNELTPDSSKKLQQSLKKFDVRRHRIFTKTPGDSEMKSSPGPKTILLQKEARKILNWFKLESNRADYTFSDAIEFLVRTSGVKLPKNI